MFINKVVEGDSSNSFFKSLVIFHMLSAPFLFFFSILVMQRYVNICAGLRGQERNISVWSQISNKHVMNSY